MRHHFNSVFRFAAVAAAVFVAGCSSSSGASSPPSAPVDTVTSTTEVAVTAATVAATTMTEAATTTQAATTSEAATTTSGLPGVLAGYPKPVPGDFPDGVFAVDITDADLAAVNDHAVAEDHGHYVWTFAQGIWSYVQTADNPLQNPTGMGTYAVDGTHVLFYGAPDDPGQDFVWVVTPEGSLQLTYQASTTPGWSSALGSHPLIPVG